MVFLLKYIVGLHFCVSFRSIWSDLVIFQLFYYNIAELLDTENSFLCCTVNPCRLMYNGCIWIWWKKCSINYYFNKVKLQHSLNILSPNMIYLHALKSCILSKMSRHWIVLIKLTFHITKIISWKYHSNVIVIAMLLLNKPTQTKITNNTSQHLTKVRLLKWQHYNQINFKLLYLYNCYEM